MTDQPKTVAETSAVPEPSADPKSPRVAIDYCPGCRWMMRAAWTAQELMTTFADDLNEVAIRPAREAPGIFRVWLDDELIHDRKLDGGFLELKQLKQRIRDVLKPEKSLGHSDKK
eukprot:Clim_evm22s202 gene=Clim_evmTU22s202